MKSLFKIRTLQKVDIERVTDWSRKEGFAPGFGDVNIYKNTDKQGLWIGSLGSNPIGCIAGIKYNSLYGFIGLFIVDKIYRGNGYGVKLWKHVIDNLNEVTCLGIEAAPDRISDYKLWGFEPSSITTRWMINKDKNFLLNKKFQPLPEKYHFIEGSNIKQDIIQEYDNNKENTPRPHFLSDWLSHKDGTVIAVVDNSGSCVAFSRIRPCLLVEGVGHRVGPLIADSPLLASFLLLKLISSYQGVILIDSPGLNPKANKLFISLGFNEISHTVRMYKGKQPSISMNEIYGLACLELG